MPVSINSIPSDLKVPLFYAEVDNSQANTATSAMPRLIVSQVNDDAVAPEIGKLTLVPSLSLAKSIGGAGSMLAEMYDTWRAIDPAGEVWCLPVKGTGTKATGKVTVTGTATAGGQINLYVGGRLVRATIANGATAAAIAAAVNAAGLSVSAVAAPGEVTLTCRWAGLSGNDIQLQMNRQGRANGEITPAGLTVTITAMAAGAGTPDLAAALAVLGDEPFEFLCAPWADATSLDAWKSLMNDSSGRWSWSRQLYGHVYDARQRRRRHALAPADDRATDRRQYFVGGTPSRRKVWPVRA